MLLRLLKNNTDSDNTTYLNENTDTPYGLRDTDTFYSAVYTVYIVKLLLMTSLPPLR